MTKSIYYKWDLDLSNENIRWFGEAPTFKRYLKADMEKAKALGLWRIFYQLGVF